MEINRDWAVDKFLDKYSAAYPNKQPPSRKQVEQYIDNRIKLGKHIIYPLAGMDWSQEKWQKERAGKSGDNN